jgi:hypothetical protein
MRDAWIASGLRPRNDVACNGAVIFAAVLIRDLSKPATVFGWPACTPATAVFSRRALRPVVCSPGEDARHGATWALTGPFQNYRNVNFFVVATAECRRVVIMVNFGLAAIG